MAKIHGFEKVIIEVLNSADESLGLQTVEKKRFADFDEISLQYHQDLMLEALEKIYHIFGIDSQRLRTHANNRLTDFNELDQETQESIERCCHTFGIDLQSQKPDISLFVKTIETLNEIPSVISQVFQEVSIYNATDKQVLWELMSRVYIPLLAINLKEFDGLTNRWDKGMPATEFWFLPSLENGKIMLPVPKVMRWWLDLLGIGRTRLADMIIKGLKNVKKGSELKESELNGIEENLKTWYTGSSLPSAEKIRNYCSLELEYAATFSPAETLSLEEQFQAALTFVRDKKALEPKSLFLQLFGMKLETLKAVYSGSVNEEIKSEFVQRVTERYAPPAPDVLKKRFMLARMVQHGYLEIAQKFGVKNPNRNSDFYNNNALQLVVIFRVIYDMVSAAKQETGVNTPKEMRNFFKKKAIWVYEYLKPFYSDNPQQEFPKYLDSIFSDQPADGTLKKGGLVDFWLSTGINPLENCITDVELKKNPLLDEEIAKKAAIESTRIRFKEAGLEEFFERLLKCNSALEAQDWKKELNQELENQQKKYHRHDTILQNAKMFLSHRYFDELQKLTASISDFEMLYQICDLEIQELEFEMKPFESANKLLAHLYGLIHQMQTLANDHKQRFWTDYLELFWHAHPKNSCKHADSDKKATELLNRLEKCKPYSETHKAHLLLHKGRLLVQLHDFKVAQKCYLDALKLGTKQSSIGSFLNWIVFEGAMLSAFLGTHFSKFWKVGIHRNYFTASEPDIKQRLEEEFRHYFSYSFNNAKPIEKMGSRNDKLIQEATTLALKGQLSEFGAFLERHFQKKPNKKTTDTRGDTLLNILFKLLKNPQLNDMMQTIESFNESFNMIETAQKLIVPTSAIMPHTEDVLKEVDHNINGAIKILLSKVSIDVNQQDFKGQTALHFATSFADIDIVNVLLEKGAKIDICDFRGKTSLMGAMMYRRKDMVKLLLDKGANVNKITVNDKLTPLHFAVMMGDVEVLELLLKRGANPKANAKLSRIPTTPLALSEKILQNFESHKKWLDSEGHSAASLEDYQRVKEWLMAQCH